MKVEIEVEGGRFEIVEEHFHPSGSVVYTRVFDCTIKRSVHNGIFDIEAKEELRQV